MPKAQQVTALNTAKRNSGLGNPNGSAKSANGTNDKSWDIPTVGDSHSSGENHGGLVVMGSNTS
ncbi:hypothetical protein [Algoriphagus sp. NG3]|uniref:hypothetical protein n=1 Tax=Algoriphagus sp. NG3 TaxID=3097546 RepID=UPI002A826F08|nr:hypothetical protein [Algoriphagus sp. NG3]WPR76618.1 hypothetical protein SLW71_04595 [Algoriphagus sp. NG3]